MSTATRFETIAEYIDNGYRVRPLARSGLSAVDQRNVYDYVARDIAPHHPPIVVRELLYLLRFTVGMRKTSYAHGAHRSSRGRVAPRLIAPPNGASVRTTQRVRDTIVDLGWFECERTGRCSGRPNEYSPSEDFLTAATEKRSDAVYGDIDALTIVLEYERLVDHGGHLTASQFACALWCVYSLRSTVTKQYPDRFASWDDLLEGKRSRQGRLIFPAIKLGRTTLKKAFGELAEDEFVSIRHRPGLPSVFRLNTAEAALSKVRGQRPRRQTIGVVGQGGVVASASVPDSTDQHIENLVPNRALHDLRRDVPLVWLRRVWRAGVRRRDPDYAEHYMLRNSEERRQAEILVPVLRDYDVCTEVDQRRFLLFAAANSTHEMWNRVTHLCDYPEVFDSLLAQFHHEKTEQAA
ncbi:hypothetical protein [Paraburkholderia sp. GAS348]|uniref:hypothetical protein n=1 Tax=Paraburkholderia sp. GAS348 TaxID=3035132 RepID=UPI003D1DB9E1